MKWIRSALADWTTYAFTLIYTVGPLLIGAGPYLGLATVLQLAAVVTALICAPVFAGWVLSRAPKPLPFDLLAASAALFSLFVLFVGYAVFVEMTDYGAWAIILYLIISFGLSLSTGAARYVLAEKARANAKHDESASAAPPQPSLLHRVKRVLGIIPYGKKP